jgi:hypothetical protein
MMNSPAIPIELKQVMFAVQQVYRSIDEINVSPGFYDLPQYFMGIDKQTIINEMIVPILLVAERLKSNHGEDPTIIPPVAQEIVYMIIQALLSMGWHRLRLLDVRKNNPAWKWLTPSKW